MCIVHKHVNKSSKKKADSSCRRTAARLSSQPAMFSHQRVVCVALHAHLAAYQRGFAAWPQPLCRNHPAKKKKAKTAPAAPPFAASLTMTRPRGPAPFCGLPETINNGSSVWDDAQDGCARTTPPSPSPPPPPNNHHPHPLRLVFKSSGVTKLLQGTTMMTLDPIHGVCRC